MRTPIIAANFKMHRTAAQTAGYASALVEEIRDLGGVEVVVAPPFTALDRASQAFAEGPVKLCAQDVHAEPEGAFTGEVSVAMLAELGCAYAIVGHSERRTLFGETDDSVSTKVAALLAGGLVRSCASGSPSKTVRPDAPETSSRPSCAEASPPSSPAGPKT